MRTLFAVDGSAGSFEAIQQVGPLLIGNQHQVSLYCHPPKIRVRGVESGQDAIATAEKALADAVFAQARQRLPVEAQERAKIVVGHQEPKRGINIAAEQLDADLIVMGARGLGLLQRLFVGSVSRAIVHTSKVPVWVARRRRTEANEGPNILIACKCPHAARRSLDLLTQLTWPETTRITLLSVVPWLFAGSLPEWLAHPALSVATENEAQRTIREHEEEMRQNLGDLQSYVRGLPAPFNRADSCVLEGDPASLILDYISQNNIDLVVVGAPSDRSAMAVLGSTSEGLLNHAECSTLIIPAPESP